MKIIILCLTCLFLSLCVPKLYRRYGRWHGFGCASFTNGDRYEGEYKFDQRHGKGTYEYHNGEIYEGEFLEDKRHGKGKLTWPNGKIYIGDFVNGKQKEGHGKYIFADGRKCVLGN